MSHIHSQSLYVAVRHLAVRQKDPELRTHVMMMWIWIQPFYFYGSGAGIKNITKSDFSSLNSSMRHYR